MHTTDQINSRPVTVLTTIITAPSIWANFLISAIALLSVFIPQQVFASSCSSIGYTVEYINGVSDTLEEARRNQQSLLKILGSQYKGQLLDVKLAYNSEHLAGVGDVVESIAQMLMGSISDYDLHTMLRQMAVDDTTRKLLLVGHSQGALYANSIYGYVTANGEPARSVDVYAVATPASYVAGGGKYINSVEDAVIYSTRLLAQKLGVPAPLQNNVSMVGGSTLACLPATHSFPTYVDGTGNQMLRDIDSQLDELVSQPSSATSGCFTPPAQTTADHIQQSIFAVADPVANAAKTGVMLAYDGTAGVLTGAVNFAQSGKGVVGSAMTFIEGVFSSPAINPAAPENEEKNFAITKKLYGSSVDKQEYDSLHKEGAAAILAFLPDAPAATTTATSTNFATTTATTTTRIVSTSTPVLAIAAATTSTATSTSAAPYHFFGGSALPSPESVVDGDASTTPPAPQLFDVGAMAPILRVAACAASSTSYSCVIATTTAILSWNGVPNAVGYSIEVNGVHIASTTNLSSTIVLEDQATSTLALVAYDIQNDTLASPSQSVVVEAAPSVPLPPHQLSPVEDSFDAFNSAGWQVFDGGFFGVHKLFDFDDGADGSCFRGGCIIGNDPVHGYINIVPNMSLQMEPALDTGAYSIYIKITTGFNTPTPAITVCEAGHSDCQDSSRTFVTGLHFFGPASVDGTWHRVYVAWRQGTSHVQSCILQDDINSADCAWVDTLFPLGTTFDGVSLWSANGWRNDLGGNIWFDELEAQ